MGSDSKKGGANAAKKTQRIRPTNKSLEAQRFSSIKMPRSSELLSTSSAAASKKQQQIHEEDLVQKQGGAPSSADAAFDPIPNDPMFSIVENSKYWPPMSLEELQKSSGMTLAADGMDLYDRREDDANAKKEKVAKMKGEVNHPRGKATKNVKVSFDDDNE